MIQDDFMRQMAKAAKKQIFRMVLPVIIGVGVVLFIIGFVLGAIIF